MIRTHIVPCRLPKDRADYLNSTSGSIYTGILVTHWRVARRKDRWLSEFAAKRWGDRRTDACMHSHSIDAAQEGFYKACTTTRALRKAGFTEAKFPHRRRKFRTTIWKKSAIKRVGDAMELSNGRGNPKIVIAIPECMRDAFRFLEVRLVYDKKALRYTWHIVVENGKQPGTAPGPNVVAVDLGEIHPAVVGDESSSTIVICRERRHESQGHAKRLSKMQESASRKTKGSRRYRRLMSSKARMKAKHERVTRDMEHKISRAVVDVAVEHKAGTIVIGDVRDIADGVACGKVHNGRTSRWDHGKVRKFISYKADSEGIKVKLADEKYTTQTCPTCSRRHKPRGRVYRCPSCGFQAHRDVVGCVNILSVHKHGEPGKIPAPSIVKHRIPHNLRVMRRRPDTGQERMPVAREQSRETAGF